MAEGSVCWGRLSPGVQRFVDHLVIQSDNYLIGLHLGIGQSGVEISSEPLTQFSDGDLVEVNVQLLLQLIEILLLGLA